MADLYEQVWRAELRSNHFNRTGDKQMAAFWTRLYYYLRRKLHEQELRDRGDDMI